MTNEQLQKVYFYNELKTKILRVAFELQDDELYTREDATEDLLKIAMELRNGSEI